jgi:multidrug efflux pump subunit AcrA (membrane-fusion protein)
VNPASPLFAILSVGGGIVTVAGGLLAWFKLGPEIRKLRSEARRSDVEAAVAEDKAEDDHTAALTARYRELIAEQTEAVVKPMREELDRVSAKAAALEQRVDRMQADIDALRTRYWRAIAHIRALLGWVHRHHPDPTGLPIAPVEIANDI